MDPFAVFALTVGMVIAASQQAAVMEQYAARARAVQPQITQPMAEALPVAYALATPAAPPVPGWIPGAAVGAQIGALASAANPVVRCGGRACGVGYDPRPVIAGALIGGLIGQVASTPPPVVHAQVLEAQPIASRRSHASTREFTDHWQAFMQPSVSRSAEPATGGRTR